MDPSFLVILVLAFGAMWLMTSRTRKQQKEAANFRANLTAGQEVMTGSGLFGTVVEVEDDVVVLETSPGVTSRWLRPAIAKLIDPPVVTDEPADEDLDDEEYDEDLEDEDYEDDELDDATLAEDGRTAEPVVEPVGESPIEVPDDASSLTEGRDDEGTPRR
jgi:preprotein translocase subunit YajC